MLMLRGHQQIFLSLFDNPPLNLSHKKKERKGRSEDLHAKRNELLIHRYYYYTRVANRQYADALTIMEQTEFFISTRTIIDTIQANTKMLSDLNTARPERKFFKDKYPFMNWV